MDKNRQAAIEHGGGDPEHERALEQIFRELDAQRITLSPSDQEDLREARRVFLRGMRERGHDKHWTPELANLSFCDAYRVLERRAARAAQSNVRQTPASK